MQAKTATQTRTERREVAILKRELAGTQSYLQSLLAEKDKGNEELRAANEEIQSSNEELQSVNEELETTKEELQSSNEELRTVNEELESRNALLALSYDDLANLLRSMSVPTVVVDRDLAIRRYTPGTEAVLHLIDSDIGRPITDIAGRLPVPDLRELLCGVIEQAATVEREVRDEEGRWYSLRVRPFLTVEGRIDGAVLTFVDIDELQRSLEATRAAAGLNESLNRMIAALATCRTAALALPVLLREAAATLAADAAAIALRADGSWVITYGDGLPSGAIGLRFSDREFPQAPVAAEARVPVTINVPDSARARAAVKRLGLGSVLIAPLTVADVVGGVLLFSWKAAAPVNGDRELDFAAKIAALVSLAVENERLHQEPGPDEPAT